MLYNTSASVSLICSFIAYIGNVQNTNALKKSLNLLSRNFGVNLHLFKALFCNCLIMLMLGCTGFR